VQEERAASIFTLKFNSIFSLRLPFSSSGNTKQLFEAISVAQSARPSVHITPLPPKPLNELQKK
jgi:hypothetical protein